jgi:hypothetical protein
MDDILKNSKNEMNSIPQTPDMWKKIQKNIQSEKQNILQQIWDFIFDHKMVIATGFACIIIILTISFFHNPTRLISATEAEKLANKIDDDVYKAQQLYEHVIAEMELNCTLSELTTDNSLAQAYFDKIHLLDQVIDLCKSSLEKNPYSPAIHKQLFFAYNEKINVYKALGTLNEKELS